MVRQFILCDTISLDKNLEVVAFKGVTRGHRGDSSNKGPAELKDF